MISVKQFRYGADNLGYLLHAGDSAMAVDGGAAPDILSFVAAQGLSLRYVANTHQHADHTSGNAALLRGSKARLLSQPELLALEGPFAFAGGQIQILPTAGHTADSLCFYTGEALISGDTLFNGTIGNCFSGDLDGFYRSIKTLMALPDETAVYAGHDYVRDSMAFAKVIEPKNKSIDDFLGRYERDHVRSTLADEKKINPYFRFNEPGIVSLLARRGLPRGTEQERWHSLMSIE